MTTASFDASETYLLAEGNSEESQKIKAATILDGLSGDLSAEVTARQNADSTLQDNINAEANARAAAINALDADQSGGDGKFIESISQTNGVISAMARSFGSIEKSNAYPVPGGSIYLYMQAKQAHSIMRIEPKDITEYYEDGTFWKRLTGTDGFELFEDIYAGDFFQMSRAITCKDSYDGTQGTSWVTIAEIDGLMYQGNPQYITAHHVVMVPGKGISTSEPNHFGRHAMNDSNTTANGYAGSKMHTEIIGPVTSTGSTASGATINEQLYAEFGSHLQTTGELLSVAMDPNAINRFGNAGGASSSWNWQSCQAVLLSEIEVYGSEVWSSSGYDTGTAKKQFAAFKHPLIQNNRLSWYWLKNVASAADFCYVNDYGGADSGGAGSVNVYVRPRFVLAA